MGSPWAKHRGVAEWVTRHQPSTADRTKTPRPTTSPLDRDAVFELTELLGPLLGVWGGHGAFMFVRITYFPIPFPIPPKEALMNKVTVQPSSCAAAVSQIVFF